MGETTIETVAALRAQLYDAGFRPVPVLNADHADPALAGKAPLGRDWGNRARQDPPECLRFAPVPHALNTGILTDGLRAFDLDIDDPEIAARCRSLVVQRFGEAPIRMRRNSCRCLILYRAATGTPSKVVITGAEHTKTHGRKIEVLGKGQQFVAFGAHPSGAELEWFPDAPGQELLASLPAVTEEDVLEMLERLAPIIGADPPQRVNGKDHAASEPQADPLRVAAAVNAIPNRGPADWEAWNRIGMAIWRATDGANIGWQAFDAWSRRNPAYDAMETRGRWDHYSKSPPTQIGAGTLFHLARQQPAPEPIPVTEPEPDREPGAPLFPLEWFRDVEIPRDSHDFVEGLLVSTSMVVIYGESNSGKTFFATDLGCHIACGWPWNGRDVERGAVIYCALEGSHGIRNRIAAFREEHGLQGHDIPFAVIPIAMNLLDPDADTGKLIRTIQEVAKQLSPLPVRLIFIDTLSRGIAGGNENAPDDMGALVTNGARIQQETGAAVAWVHHTGKDQAKGARGHSLLRAATDTEIEITADGPNRCAQVTKQRDMECVGTFQFSLKVVELGTNSRGKPITSCVVQYSDRPDESPNRNKRLAPTEARAMEVLTDLIARTGQTGHNGTPNGTLSVPADWWRDNFYERALPGQKQDTKKHAFGRASSTLINRRLVGMAHNRVWIVQMHDRFSSSVPYDEGNGT